MKVRAGFVSNSSSSSFIVCSENELNRKEVLKMLKIPEDSPLYQFATMFADYICKARELDYDDIIVDAGNFETYEEFLEQLKGPNSERIRDSFYYPECVITAMQNGHKIYDFSVHSEDLYDDPVGALLYGVLPTIEANGITIVRQY
jgi:hypothetical protein